MRRSPLIVLLCSSVLGGSACASARYERIVERQVREIEDVTVTLIRKTPMCPAGYAEYEGVHRYSPHETPDRLTGAVCCTSSRFNCRVTDADAGR